MEGLSEFDRRKLENALEIIQRVSDYYGNGDVGSRTDRKIGGRLETICRKLEAVISKEKKGGT